MNSVIYLEGTVYEMARGDYYIYVHRNFKKYIQDLKGKRVRIIIIGEIEE